jgi:hypothetical protein
MALACCPVVVAATNAPPAKLPRVFTFLSKPPTWSSRVPTQMFVLDMVPCPLLVSLVTTWRNASADPREYVFSTVAFWPLMEKVHRATMTP